MAVVESGGDVAVAVQAVESDGEVAQTHHGAEQVAGVDADLSSPPASARGQSPSVASIYRALAARAKREAYPEAVEAAHADFAALRAEDLG
ncbi:hypothetical protein ACF06X_14975 [Streptomyces sp. NPDC015346]|uniref:hypothetical protein n=1 Tax=Streptomyces sp. NPDC015346 TaxID=3364954 RepID=UPI0036F4D8A8